MQKYILKFVLLKSDKDDFDQRVLVLKQEASWYKIWGYHWVIYVVGS